MIPTQVDFYVLSAHGTKVLSFACTLIEKLFTEGQRIYVQMQTLDEVARLDHLLWTFNDIAFLPHGLADGSATPIQIGITSPTRCVDALINLTQHLPEMTGHKRIIEFVLPDPVMQQLSRERFRAYRQANCEITTHKIKDNDYDYAQPS